MIEKVQQGFTHQEIRDMYEEKTGYNLTREQITYDINTVRESWQKKQLATYEAYVNEELAWLDMFERQLWNDYRESARPTERKKIEEIAKKASGDSEEGTELVVDAITTYLEENGTGDPKLLDMILKTRQDRRKILGLYAPSKAIIRTEHVSMDNVQRYKVVDPDDWDEDDVVEGEFSDNGE